ncbi:MAG: hypothetical protein AAF582_12520 [Pseudomonadota bacterium]
MARIADDAWGVWRTKDRRGRIVGTVLGADVDILRLQGCLRQFGKTEPQLLIWDGPIEAPQRPAERPEAARATQTNAPRPLLETIILNAKTTVFRQHLRHAIEAYHADFESIGRTGGAQTMNWDALKTGPQIRSHQPVDLADKIDRATAARVRLKALQDALIPSDRDLLVRLVIAKQTKSQLSKRFGIRAALMEQNALRVLRQLLQIYDGELMPKSWRGQPLA